MGWGGGGGGGGGKRVKVSESRTLAREWESLKREHGEQRVDSTVKEGRFQKVEEGEAKRASLGQVKNSISG